MARFTAYGDLFDWTSIQVEIDQQPRQHVKNDHPKLPNTIFEGLILGGIALTVVVIIVGAIVCFRNNNKQEYHSIPTEESRPINVDDF